MRVGIVVLAMLASVSAGGGGGGDIYPDGHWTRSNRMTTSNFDDIVKREVDAGKTLFVRWIASSG